MRLVESDASSLAWSGAFRTTPGRSIHLLQSNQESPFARGLPFPFYDKVLFALGDERFEDPIPSQAEALREYFAGVSSNLAF